MAAHTTRARLGLMVGGVHYRQPGLWVKAATTLDVLSGGRAWLGIGAAWNEEESRGARASRSRRSASASSCSRTRSGSPTRCGRASAAREAAFDGRHVHADAAAQLARSRSPGRTRRSWSAAAASGRRSASSPSTPTPATSSAGPRRSHHKYEILREHCDGGRAAVRRDRALEPPGRRPDRPAGGRGASAAGRLVERFGELADAGVQHVIVSPHARSTRATARGDRRRRSCPQLRDL